jgi:type IV pilus assembly protein PilY1
MRTHLQKILSALAALPVLLLLPVPAAAFLDTFVCDSAIYSSGGTLGGGRPNVLFIINNSRNMVDQKSDTEAYDPTVEYLPSTYARNGAYFRNNPSSPWQSQVAPKADGSLKVNCAPAVAALQDYGFWKGGLDGDGNCSSKNNDQNDYFLGNLVNKLSAVKVVNAWESNKLYQVGDVIRPTNTASPLRFRMVGFEDVTKQSGSSEPDWPVEPGPTEIIKDAGVRWQVTSSILALSQAVVKQVVGSLRNDVNVGVMIFGNNNDGGMLAKTPEFSTGNGLDGRIRSIGDNSADQVTNFNTLYRVIDTIPHVSSNTSEDIAGAVWDAGVYYRGRYDDTNIRLGQPRYAVPSPITSSCQYNFILVLTTGASEPNTTAQNAIEDQTGLGFLASGDEAPLDGVIGPNDAAKKVNQIDPAPSFSPFMLEKRRIRTSIIQFLTKSGDLEDAALKSGGEYALVNDTAALRKRCGG